MSKTKRRILGGMLLFVALSCGCGKQPAQQPEETLAASKELSVDAKISQADAELEAIKASRDAVLTLGVYYNFVGDHIKHTVDGFNSSQEKYWIELKEYDSRSNLVMEIIRGEGADLFSLKHMPFDMMAGKNVLEDLTPYFEKSENLKKEDIVSSVWRAGTVQGKFVGVIPYFDCGGYLVEKGYTDKGEWSVEEYFALGEKYPDAKLHQYVDNISMYTVNFLEEALATYVDWEQKTCTFDSENFKNFLVKIKENSEKQYPNKGATNEAESMFLKEELTKRVSVSMSPHMNFYRDIRDSFFESFEIAGIPNNEGIAKYDMSYYEMYGMNRNSQNKEAAWAFIEYILSDAYQTKFLSPCFPARVDLLEKGLQEEVDFVLPENYTIYSTSRFTGERTSNFVPITKEDKELILYIIDNSYRSTLHYDEIYYIVTEEAGYYWEGDKTIDEVMRIIQNRVMLYLSE